MSIPRNINDKKGNTKQVVQDNTEGIFYSLQKFQMVQGLGTSAEIHVQWPHSIEESHPFPQLRRTSGQMWRLRIGMSLHRAGHTLFPWVPWCHAHFALLISHWSQPSILNILVPEPQDLVSPLLLFFLYTFSLGGWLATWAIYNPLEVTTEGGGGDRDSQCHSAIITYFQLLTLVVTCRLWVTNSHEWLEPELCS